MGRCFVKTSDLMLRGVCCLVARCPGAGRAPMRESGRIFQDISEMACAFGDVAVPKIAAGQRDAPMSGATHRPLTTTTPQWALSRQRKARARARTVAPSRRVDVAPAALGRLRLPSLSLSTPQCSRGSGLVRLPAVARAAAGIARWRRCAPPASELDSLPRGVGCFSLRSA